MKTLALHVAAISVLLAGTASAADLRRPAPVKAPAPVAAPVVNWTGCYLGVGGGYGMYNVDQHAILDATGAPATVQSTTGGRGWLITGQVGCDLQVGGSWVIGAFADYDWRNIEGDFHSRIGDTVGELKNKSAWAAGGRLGYLVTPGLLGYVSGGYTQAKFDSIDNMIGIIGGAPTNLRVAGGTFSGWFIGGGTEYALSWFPGLFWKSEYRFSDYSSETRIQTVASTGAPTGFSQVMSPTIHTVRSEIVWRFNWGGPVVARY